MTPITTGIDRCDSWSRDAKSFRDCVMALATKHTMPNLSDVIICQCGSMMINPTRHFVSENIEAVMVVFAGRDPFEIFQSIIKTISVFVVNLMDVGRRRASKRAQYHHT